MKMNKDKVDVIMYIPIMPTKEKEAKLGTRMVREDGRHYKYAKIDFGPIGKIDGKQYRNILYAWLCVRI
jgi:hypothetical protein